MNSFKFVFDVIDTNDSKKYITKNIDSLRIGYYVKSRRKIEKKKEYYFKKRIIFKIDNEYYSFIEKGLRFSFLRPPSN